MRDELTRGIQGIWDTGDEKVRNGTLRKRNPGMLEDRSQITAQNPGKVPI
jgi:hypothetical protein